MAANGSDILLSAQDAVSLRSKMSSCDASDTSTGEASRATWEGPPLLDPGVQLASCGHKFQLREWDGQRFIKTSQSQPLHGRKIEYYYDTSTHRQIAVKRFTHKLLEKMRAVDERILENPWTELRIGSWQSHQTTGSHQVAYGCLGAFIDVNGDGLLAMDLLHGGDLFDYVASLGMPGLHREAIIMPVVKSLLAAVASLHCHGIAHGDISVENIMFRGDQGVSDVIFVDFRMAVIGRLATTAFGLRGKVMYRAPEMLESCCYDAFAADLFAIGIVVYSLAIGRYPWRSTVPGVCKCYDYVRLHGLPRFMQKRVVPKTGGRTVADCMSGNLQRLVGTLLSNDPQRRFKAISSLPRDFP